jgi:hypothetical protein
LEGEHSDSVWAMQMSGTRAITGDWSGSVVMWDTLTGKSILKKVR